MWRSAMVLCGASLLVGTPVANAQPGPACVVIVDPSGDETGPAGSPAAKDTALDIRQVTLRSDGRSLTAVLVVGGGASADSRIWSVTFGNGEQNYTFSAFEHIDGDRFAAYGPGSSTNQPPAGNATGSIDLTQGRVLITVPLTQIHVGPRARFYDFSASSNRSIGSNSATGPQSTNSPFLGGDTARGSTQYRLDQGCPR
jgi:hypothetical protein